MIDLKEYMQYLFLRLRMLSIKYFLWKPLIRMTRKPEKQENLLLLKIIKSNSNSSFGKKHNFSSIDSYAEFIEKVPIRNYEEHRRFIDEQFDDDKCKPRKPCFYSQTSGTSGKAKLIPIYKSTIDQYSDSQSIVAYTQYKYLKGVYKGKVLAIVSPALEGFLENGIGVGSMSGFIYESMPISVKSKYLLPSSIFALKDYEKKYFLIAAFSLAERNITLIATANPSTLIKISDTITSKFPELLSLIKYGSKHGLKANPQRAEELKNIFLKKNKITFSEIWPNLCSVTTWTGGTSSFLIPQIKRILPSQTRIIEMGYLSTEFRGTININLLENQCIPAINENFFEFIDRDEWDNRVDNVKYLRLKDLTLGNHYYIITTTTNGLYRYFIDDVVKVDGFFNKTPTLSFVQKGKGFTSLTGEKLSEYQVVQTMRDLNKELQLDIQGDAFMMLACNKALRYYLFIESKVSIDITECLEKRLSDMNLEFREKRSSGRLKVTVVRRVNAGTFDAFKKHSIESGKREGQYKLLKLQYLDQVRFNFWNYINYDH